MFADTHAALGILPRWGMTLRLPAAVGARRARQMMLGAERITADTARDWGLVNEVVARETLLHRALHIARTLAERDTDVTGRLLGLIRTTGAIDATAALDAERQENARWRERRRERDVDGAATD